MYKKIQLLLIGLLCSYLGITQNKYLEVVNGGLYPVEAYSKVSAIAFVYKDASKQKLAQYLLNYAKQSGFVIKRNVDDVIVIRSFQSFCKNESDSCATKGGLVSLTWLTLKIFDEKLDVYFKHQLYSNFFNAELLINYNDDVASVNNVPFDHYSFTQPYPFGSYKNLAYTDCVFDPNDNIVNPNVKREIEYYYNSLVDNLYNSIKTECKK